MPSAEFPEPSQPERENAFETSNAYYMQFLHMTSPIWKANAKDLTPSDAWSRSREQVDFDVQTVLLEGQVIKDYQKSIDRNFPLQLENELGQEVKHACGVQYFQNLSPRDVFYMLKIVFLLGYEFHQMKIPREMLRSIVSTLTNHGNLRESSAAGPYIDFLLRKGAQAYHTYHPRTPVPSVFNDAMVPLDDDLYPKIPDVFRVTYDLRPPVPDVFNKDLPDLPQL